MGFNGDVVTFKRAGDDLSGRAGVGQMQAVVVIRRAEIISRGHGVFDGGVFDFGIGIAFDVNGGLPAVFNLGI